MKLHCAKLMRSFRPMQPKMRTLASWLKHVPAPAAVLVVLLVTEAMFCIDHYGRRWQAIAVARQARANDGEGLVIRHNGLGYYSWLRSALVDRDWSFDNEFDEHTPPGDYVPPPAYRTALDRRANQWSVGPAVLWSVTVVPVHFALRAWEGNGSPWAADGYSLPYQLVVGGTSFAYAAVGVGFLYGVCRRFARPTQAALATAWLTLGTTMFYYNAAELSLPHGLGTAAIAAFVWYWSRTYGSLQPRRWIIVGALLGLATLIRWQLVTFAVLPLGEAVLNAARSPGPMRSIRRQVGLLGATALGALLAFTPQLIAWKCVYGAWLASPVQGVAYHWLRPSLREIIVSSGSNRSLFYWTPMAFVALAAALAALWSNRTKTPPFRGRESHSEQLSLLLLSFVVQVYVLASMWGKGEVLPHTGTYGGVFLARSFGFRHLTESLVVLAPGVALLLDRLRGWRYASLCLLCSACAVWNLLLASAYSHGVLPQAAGHELAPLLSQTRRMLGVEPETLVFALLGPGCLAAICFLAKLGPALERRREIDIP